MNVGAFNLIKGGGGNYIFQGKGLGSRGGSLNKKTHFSFYSWEGIGVLLFTARHLDRDG